jgi:surfactin synthase thioesterase subunit
VQLPACANPSEARLDEAEIARQRAALVSQLADEIGAAAGEQPYALYGFSFGAMLMYGVCLELSTRGRPPLLLCTAGRGAAHAATLTRVSVVRPCPLNTRHTVADEGGAADGCGWLRMAVAALMDGC